MLTHFCFSVLWLSHKCKCPLGIFQLYRRHQYQPLWDLFSHLRKTIIHSRLEFRTDRTAFYKCHCHRRGWAASGHSSHVWRKGRVNDDRDWQGVCEAEQDLYGPHQSAPVSPVEAVSITFCFQGPQPLWGDSLHLDLWRPQNFFGSCWNQGSSFQKSAWHRSVTYLSGLVTIIHALAVS